MVGAQSFRCEIWYYSNLHWFNKFSNTFRCTHLISSVAPESTNTAVPSLTGQHSCICPKQGPAGKHEEVPTNVHECVGVAVCVCACVHVQAWRG